MSSRFLLPGLHRGVENVHGESNKWDQNSQASKKTTKSTTSVKPVFNLPGCGFVAFKFAPRQEEKRCWNVSCFVEWQACWCADLYVLLLKGWGSCGTNREEGSALPKWKGMDILSLAFSARTQSRKHHLPNVVCLHQCWWQMVLLFIWLIIRRLNFVEWIWKHLS